MCFCSTIFATIMKLRKILMGFVLQDGLSPLYVASQEGHLDLLCTECHLQMSDLLLTQCTPK